MAVTNIVFAVYLTDNIRLNTNQKFTDAVSDIPETVNIVLPEDTEINNILLNNSINKDESMQSNQIKESANTFIF